MPPDYASAAAALSLSTSPSPPTSPNGSRPTTNSPGNGSAVPPWARNGNSRPSAASRRLSARPQSLHTSIKDKQSLPRQLYNTAVALGEKTLKLFFKLTPLQRGLVVLALLVLGVLSILGMVYSHQIFTWLVPRAKEWRALSYGWAILWAITFATAFPPMIGYSTACSLAGFVFGFPWGWPIVATASVAGSFVAFLTSRGIFSSYVNRLVGQDNKFRALSQVLKHDGLWTLTMIRWCPLPFSLSNGFLATIPSIRPWAFAAATALASPKLAVHVFIGSRLFNIIDEGDSMSTTDKAINYGSMVFGSVLATVVSVFIYRKTMARAAELALEEGEIASEDGGDGEGFADVADDAARLAGDRSGPGQPDGTLDEDAAALMDDDDISLWDVDGDDGWGYRDSTSNEEHGGTAKDGENGKDPAIDK